MNEDIKERWLEALRSGVLPDGTEVEQTTRYLRVDDDDVVRSCCLGVLCEIAVADGVVTRENGGDVVGYTSTSDRYDHSSTVLPVAVIKWAGLNYDEENKFNSKEVEVNAIGKENNLLTALNDNEGYTFEQIADVIEEQL